MTRQAAAGGRASEEARTIVSAEVPHDGWGARAWGVARSDTGFHHFVEHVPQRVVLQGRGDPLLVGQLPVDLVILGVRSGLHPDVDAVARRQGLLQADADGQANDGGEGAVGDGGRDLDEHLGKSWRCLEDMDVGEIYHGELAQGMGMLRVRDCGYEVCDGSE